MTTTALDLKRYPMYIGGRFRENSTGATFDTINPFTEEPWATVAEGTAQDVDDAVNAARAALEGEWGAMTGFQRADLLRVLATLISQNAEKLAEAEVADSGKLYREMIVQVRSLSRWFTYFAGAADKLEGKTIPAPNPDHLVYTSREPVGVVAAITPWNAPLLLLAFKLAPALAAGCTVVVKPSEHASASTLVFAQLVHEAGFPDGVFNVVTSSDPRLGAALSGHPGVDKVVFTGSTSTGRAVAQAAAENLNGVTLELGGKSPQIVFADADLDEAATGIVSGIFAAAGQTCMAGSRLLAHHSILDDLVRRVVSLTAAIKTGDPMDVATQLGPIANRQQYEHVIAMLSQAAAEGATFEIGGGADPARGGLFVQPTIVSGINNSMGIAREEVFGPVLTVMGFDSEREAVRIANDTAYGLAAGVWTADIRRAHRVAARVKAGTVWINTYRSVAPSVPFGGFKASGMGRENGVDSVLDYTETKSVWVNLGSARKDPFVLG
ncbi:aldehyde dehydrogenase [Pseudarthrobacter phenanthrenivorans]|uniref:aldehyde dehydrogenase n=1 Tax=Pseudarthrobacter phenanthrenivorans TaxID=361575 RepID=UPI002F34F885